MILENGVGGKNAPRYERQPLLQWKDQELKKGVEALRKYLHQKCGSQKGEDRMYDRRLKGQMSAYFLSATKGGAEASALRKSGLLSLLQTRFLPTLAVVAPILQMNPRQERALLRYGSCIPERYGCVHTS